MNIEPEKTEATGDSDPSQYIRTFAKDFARLSGRAPVAVTPTKEPKKNLFAKRQAADPIIKTRLDESLITNTDKKPKPVDLSDLERDAERIDTEIQTTKESVRDIQEQQEDKITPLPITDPSDTVDKIGPEVLHATREITPIQEKPTATADAEREAILSRLKARVANHAQKPAEEIRAVEPAPVTQTPEPVEFHAVSTPITTPVAIPLAPAFHAAQRQENTTEALHTYKSDFADHIQETSASAFSVLAAEKDAKKPAPIKQKRVVGPQIAVVLGAVLFLLAAGGAIYETYIYINKSAPITILPAPATPIIADSSAALSGTGQGLLQALAQEASQPISVNNIVNTYVTEATTTTHGQIEEPATGGAFIAELNLPAPDILLRNIDPSSMVGIINAGGETRPFFIIKVTSYQRTFSGMLTWEPTIFTDLSLLYPKYPESAVQSVPASVATTTATSTSTQALATSSSIFIPPTQVDQTQPASQFTDEVVANHPARILTDLAGRTLLIYGYADKQTLIIARNEAAFTLLLNRLQANTSNQ